MITFYCPPLYRCDAFLHFYFFVKSLLSDCCHHMDVVTENMFSSVLYIRQNAPTGCSNTLGLRRSTMIHAHAQLQNIAHLTGCQLCCMLRTMFNKKKLKRRRWNYEITDWDHIIIEWRSW